MRRVRPLYEQAGFRVICHGYRGHWWKDTDPRFLDKQLAELRRHRRVGVQPAEQRASSTASPPVASPPSTATR